MAAMTREQILRKAEKMTRFDPERATQAEVELAATMLRKLLDKHGLSMADIKDTSHKTTVIQQDVPTDYQNLPAWKDHVAMVVSKAYDCKVIIGQWEDPQRKYGSRWKARYIFIGHETDCAIATYFYTILCRELWNAGQKEADMYGRKRHRKTKFVASFITGGADAVAARLKEQRASMTEEEKSDCTAIVFVKDTAIKEYVRDTFPHLTRGRRRNSSRSDFGGYDAGESFGKRMSLNEGVEGGQSAQRRIS